MYFSLRGSIGKHKDWFLETVHVLVHFSQMMTVLVVLILFFFFEMSCSTNPQCFFGWMPILVLTFGGSLVALHSASVYVMQFQKGICFFFLA